MSRKVPLWTPGGARGSGRPYGMPSLVTGPLANGAAYFDDFFLTSVGAPLALGHPHWVATNIAGTGSAGSGAGAVGNLNLTTGATSGNAILVEAGTRATVSSGSIFSASTVGVVMFRFSAATVATTDFGLGLVPTSLAQGTDWLTDPDVTLLGTTLANNSLVITRHVLGYSGDGAGELILRYYESTDTDSISLRLATSVSNTTYVKVELAITIGGSITAYVNGASVGSIACPTASSLTGRPAFIARTTTNAARSMNVDAYYQEAAQSSAR